MRTLITFLLALGVFNTFAAPKPPVEPVLRIETGGHLAPISDISTDASGRWVVTSSEDKTARIWDARTGQALSVLRPPIGAESLGALYSSAISPDGRTIALGGFSDFDGNGHLLHLFNRTSSTIPPKSTVTGLEAPTTQMTWSRNSQLLAIGLRQGGLRVFLNNLQLAGEDAEYNEAIFGLDFSAQGLLAATSMDGYLRIYSVSPNQLKRIARKKLPGGKPYSVAFSPDGQTLAAGYQDNARIDLLDAINLNIVHSISRKGGNLGRVAWSTDGNTLYAAGTHSKGGNFPVLAFNNAGYGSGVEIGNFSNTVTSIAPLADGSVVAASAQADWKRLSATQGTLTASNTQTADFRDSGSSFQISASGETISFQWSPDSATMLFDIPKGILQVYSGTNTTLQVPKVHSALSQWKNSYKPLLSGKPLTLQANETVRSTSASNNNFFALGTDWNLRYFDNSGKQLWQMRTPATAWTINLSANGRWLVAGLGDGSIRWYNTSDGAEQLALYVHQDLTRWITWTPQGYYNTSAGGEKLVGWHINRAFNQSADFFTAGRFRDRLYRPEMLQNILAMDAKPETIKALENLPPLIELQSDSKVETLADFVTVRYKLRTPPEAPVNNIKVRVNGKLERTLQTTTSRSKSAESTIDEIKVRIPTDKDSEILLIAENRHAKSDPVSIQVKRTVTETTAATSAQPLLPDFDTLYILLVAVNKYPKGFELQSPVKDVTDFKNHMELMAKASPHHRKIYKKLEIKTLTDETATRSSISDGLAWLKSKVGTKDAGVLFLAGHGYAKESSYFYIPYLGKSGDIKDSKEWLHGDLVVNTLQSLPGRAIFFLDTCYAGAFANQAKLSTNTTSLINRIDDERGVTIFASSTGKQESGEDDQNGYFTKALLEGLKGEAADKSDGLIYPSSLKRYVTRRVKQLSNNEQSPFISDLGVDEPIAVVIK